MMPALEPITITSPSMEPVIATGETVFLRAKDNNIKAGDIIAFESVDKTFIVVHRLLQIQKQGGHTYLIQGPEKGRAPTVVEYERYLGKIFLPDHKKNTAGYEWRPIRLIEKLRAKKIWWLYFGKKRIKRLARL